MESYLHKVLPFVPGCPEAVVEQKILEAAIDLCKDSFCWRKENNVVVPAASEEDETTIVPISTDTGAQIVSIPVCLRDNLPITAYYLSGTDIVLEPWPQESTVKFTIAQKPLEDLEALPDGFKAMQWEGWVDGMAAKAKAILYGMAGQKWYNPEKEVSETSKYNTELGKIRRQIQQKNPMVEMRVQSRPFI